MNGVEGRREDGSREMSQKLLSLDQKQQQMNSNQGFYHNHIIITSKCCQDC